MGLLEWSQLVALSILWGGSFFFVEVALTELTPLTIVLLRVGIAAIMLWFVAIIFKQPIPSKADVWIAFAGMGLLNNLIPFLLIAWSQTHISSGLASILNATVPLFSILVAHIYLQDEKLSKNKTIGIAFGFAGVSVMFWPSIQIVNSGTFVAQLAMLGAALSYGCASVFGRRFRELGVQPLVTSAGQLTCSTLALIPFVFWLREPGQLALPGSSVLAAIAALAIFSTAFAYLLYFRILSTAGATNLALVTLLIPVTAVLLGGLFLHEKLDSYAITGMLLIVASLSVIDGRLFSKRGGGVG